MLLNIPSPIKFLHEKLPNKSKLGLYFNPYDKVPALIDDCIACNVDKLIAQYGGPVWQESDFIGLHMRVRPELNEVIAEIAKQVDQMLTMAFAINKRLKGRVDITLSLALADIKSLLADLIYPGFVTHVGWKRLSDTLRYLQADRKTLS